MKILTKILCAALLLSLITGCSSDKNKSVETSATIKDTLSPSDSGEIVTDSAPNQTEAPDNIEETDKKQPISPDDKDVSDIVGIYVPSEKDAAALEKEETKKPIIYAGFKTHVINTPLKSSDVQVNDTLVPLYNHQNLHAYLEEHSEMFDLSALDTVKEKFNDEFFNDKCLLVVSLEGSNEGSEYSLTGAWNEVDANNMDRLVFAIKTAKGSMKSAHIIIELEQDFLNLWDTWGIEYYN